MTERTPAPMHEQIVAELARLGGKATIRRVAHTVAGSHKDLLGATSALVASGRIVVVRSDANGVSGGAVVQLAQPLDYREAA